ncbi:MAG: hypothetical protein N4A33_12720 [Bacteriovoracaceae bacterium]|jgi:hypothetical protein|nr:hypothetical protein [Bacteriovoracaceae bacterium]
MIQSNIVETINNIQRSLYWDEDFMCDILQLKKTEFDRIKLSGEYRFSDIVKISSFLGVNVDDIAYNRLDFDNIRRKFLKTTCDIPDEYKVNAGTYMRNIRSMLDYVGNKLNKRVSQYVLNRFDLSQEAVDNDDLLVNLVLAQKLIDFISNEYSLTKYDIVKMGLISCSSGFKKKLTTDYHFYRMSDIALYIVQNVHKIERNFYYYDVIFRGDLFTLRSRAYNKTHEIFNSKMITNERSMLYRQSAIRFFPLLYGLPSFEIIDVNTFYHLGSEHIDYIIKDKSLF